jgi:hypothetical protein
MHNYYRAVLGAHLLLTSPTCAADNEKWPVTSQRYLSIFITLGETCAVTTTMTTSTSCELPQDGFLIVSIN